MNKYEVIEEVKKFNPFHDDLGRFSSSNSATSFTIRTKDPKKQHMADMAIARQKKKMSAGGGGGGTGTQEEQNSPEENLEPQTEHPAGNYGHSFDKSCEYVENSLGVSEKEAERLVDGVQNYSGDDSYAIRQAGLGDKDYDWAEGQAEACEDFIKQSPKWDAVAYHGREVNQAELDAFFDAAVSGDEFGLDGLTSFSSDKDIAENFADGLMYKRDDAVANVIFVSAGKLNGTSIRPISEHPREDEILVSKKQRFEIVNMENVDEGDSGPIIFYVRSTFEE